MERDGQARAYPLKVLEIHEMVTDAADVPVLVSFGPFCRSGVAAVREVVDEPTVFRVSGYLYHDDLVMYDARTDSLWSHIMAIAINGSDVGVGYPLPLA